MNKKIIVFGSCLVVFLMLITPNVNAIRFNQVENNLIEKINPFKEQFKIKDINSLYKLIDIEKLKQVINDIKDYPDGLCSSCIKNSFIKPFCITLGILAGVLFSKYAECYDPELANKLFWAFGLVWYFGLAIGCVWAWLFYAILKISINPMTE